MHLYCNITTPSDEELTEITDIALEAGGLMLQFGAETHKVEEIVKRFGDALGCDIANILVTLDSISITVISKGLFRTKIKKIIRSGVNFSILTRVDRLSIKAIANRYDKEQIKRELELIKNTPLNYAKPVVVIMVGLACGAFCILFGGDIWAFIITLISASLAMSVRLYMIHHYFNTFLTTATTAFVATILAISAQFVSKTPEYALASSVLMLIPGVPLINSAEDLIKGHINVGIFRGMLGILISLSIAVGMMIALRVTGYISIQDV